MKFSTIASVCAAATVVCAAPVSEAAAKAADGLRLLRFSGDTEPKWVTEDEKLDAMRKSTPFFDITEIAQLNRVAKVAKVASAAYPDGPKHQDQLQPILDTLSIDNMKAHLAEFTAFNNRYYKAQTGVEASQWLVDTVSGIASEHDYIEVSVAPFNHSFIESSVIAKVPGASDGPVTILGAHMDSINLQNPDNGRAPGADDDGSGSINLIEVLRALLAAEFKPATPVEFHWYAGEEAGLLGSQDIAASYSSDGVEVLAMMELDMTAYFRPGDDEKVALMTDFTDAGLTEFVRTLIDEYLSFGWVDGECGYACSDHASWNQEGFPSVIPFETAFGSDNPTIHSADDTVDVDGFSWTHSLEFAKLGLAYIYELTA